MEEERQCSKKEKVQKRRQKGNNYYRTKMWVESNRQVKAAQVSKKGESRKRRQKFHKAEVHNHDRRIERFRSRRGRQRRRTP